MAQYYQVLSQTDKTSVEGLRQYYPNVVDSGTTIQYVISSDEQQQQLASQQILVTSGEQLMVVEPTQITYQNSIGQQYLVQENATIEYQQPLQQKQTIFSMDDTQGTIQHSEPIVETQIQQPIVLNHHLQQVAVRTATQAPNVLKNKSVELNRSIASVPVRHPMQPNTVQQNRQPVQPPLRQPAQVRPTHQLSMRSPVSMQQPRPVQHVQPQKNSPNIPQDTPRPPTGRVVRPPNPNLHQMSNPVVTNLEIADGDSHEAVSLSDGSVISLADYKKILVEQQSVQSTERHETSAVTMTANAPNKRRGNRGNGSRSVRQSRGGGRNNRAVANMQETSQQQRFSAQQQLRDIEMQQHLKQRGMQPPQAPYQMQHQMQQQSHLQQQQYMQQKKMQQHRYQSVSQPQYLIQPHVAQNHTQQQQPSVLPPYVPSSQIQQIIENTPVTEDCADSIRMLVLLEDGEQRLITFTLPKEACTVQEILEQVGVTFKPETTIDVVEYTGCGLNYIVTVGCPTTYTSSELQTSGDDRDAINSPSTAMDSGSDSQSAESFPTPEPEKETPKLVAGKLAVCMHCGYLSEDFNKCLRCKRKLPDDVKSVPASTSLNSLKCQVQEKKPGGVGCGMMKANQKLAMNNVNSSPKRKPKPRVIESEPVILTLSSDEEEDPRKQTTEQLIQKLSESSVTISTVRKEPSVNDIRQNNSGELVAENDKAKDDDHEDDVRKMCISLACRTMRVGSYKFVSPEPLLVDSNKIVLKAPHVKEQTRIEVITIDKKNIVKVLVNFQKSLPVIFYYVTNVIAAAVRAQLGMVQGGDYYFDPLAREESYKRITVFPENLSDEVKVCLKQIYEKPFNIMDELTQREANNILMLTCPREFHTNILPGTSFASIRQLLIYPAGKGGLAINTEDYLCLAQDQFLNDVIIDFYLKYLMLNLPREKEERVHVFSTFFYKRLTTKPLKASRRSHPTELDPTLTPAQKRHARVKNWTKNVNLFEKDFVIIPLNENSHWFLAIICFPNQDGPITLDGRPIKIEARQKKKKPMVATIGNVTITTVKVESEKLEEDGELSDKDEAEADESELDSDQESVEEPPVESVPEGKQQRQPIKQPCILIFDSLAGASRSRVVATLRDYLTCEYKAKMGEEKIFNKDVIKGACPKVPQQTNFTDCGLYLLQYVEQFFKDPIKDYHIPISQLKNWFDEITVTKKREDISNLIKRLMREHNKDVTLLPDIALPTAEGKIIERPTFEEEEEEEEEEQDEDEEMLEEGEIPPGFVEITGTLSSENGADGKLNETRISICSSGSSEHLVTLSQGSKGNVTDLNSFIEQNVSGDCLKPDLSEMQKQSNRDTMSYLKAKRIVRHKNTDGTDIKKFKSD